MVHLVEIFHFDNLIVGASGATFFGNFPMRHYLSGGFLFGHEHQLQLARVAHGGQCTSQSELCVR